MANGGGSEHLVQITAGGGGQAKVAAPEKWLNRFVRFVVLIERLGNALGTLAFMWATVVLLGGYASELSPDDDFAFATTIVLLEAVRYVCMYMPYKDNYVYSTWVGSKLAFQK
uniref:Uncharacterized protein n=1 Tax=Aegilops tauschii subsp. strangulata TaxID=200361 RepID=A0A453AVT0_AEGTS